MPEEDDASDSPEVGDGSAAEAEEAGHAGGDDAEPAKAAAQKARLEKILREYRATLRNETESGHQGFSAEDYRKQKPPHW